jgi:hypothetical protein
MAWQGQCRGKDNKQNVRMEVVCDDYLGMVAEFRGSKIKERCVDIPFVQHN